MVNEIIVLLMDDGEERRKHEEPLKATSGQATHAPPSPGSTLALVQAAVPDFTPLSGNF